MNTITIEYPTDLPDYELIDSGDGEKLEKFQGYTVVRPDPRALWQKTLSQSIWEKADAQYHRTSSESGTWNIRTPPPDPWLFHYKKSSFLLKPTDFKHVGIFPEQAVNWDWMIRILTKACHPELAEGSQFRTEDSRLHGYDMQILNLFAYTGGATVALAQNGAHVTHVDSVKSTITWANENYTLNIIDPTRVRWIEDDAYKFVLREAKRGKIYDAIIMDPPRFGRGNHGEIWKLEHDLPKLLTACKQILSPTPLFFLINAYTADLSSLVLSNLMGNLMGNHKGTITFGELATKESSSDRLLPQGIFARWER